MGAAKGITGHDLGITEEDEFDLDFEFSLKRTCTFLLGTIVEGTTPVMV